ncbi:MAG: PAC2 family protein [Actinomycetota bacterium]
MDRILVEQQPSLEHPIMVLAFRGWNDGGEAASGAADFVKHRWGAKRCAHIDPEEFFDFQVARPTVQLEGGTTRKIEWPANEFHHARIDDRDVVVFVGIEPNMKWRTFATDIVSFGRGLGAEKLITLGAFLADVPHTRQVPVVGSASSQEEAQALGLTPSQYEGPTGIVGVAHDIANRSGLSSVSFWAAVPHYIPAGVNPKATLALVERLTSYLGVDAEAADLGTAAAAWEESVDEQVRENETLSSYVSRLEEAESEQFNITEPPSGDELAAEIERFLKERSGE